MFNFGFRKVMAEEKFKMVSNVFSSVASKYDVMNNLMSLGVQKRWKANFIDFITLKDGGRYLDLASGTGDIAMLIKQKAEREGKKISIVISDANAEMLDIAKKRFEGEDVSFIHCNAEELPLSKSEFDGVFISFGIRNFTDIKKALSGIHYNLKEGASVYTLEFFPDVSKLLFFDKIYKAYLLNVIPALGKIVVKDEASYKYFAESILNFYSKKDFINLVQGSNFKLSGRLDSAFGIVSYFHFKNYG